MFVSVDLLGPTEMILSFAQYLSKYHVHPHMFSLMFVILDYTRKKSAEIIFFTGKVACLFKSCVFNKFIGVTEMILSLQNPCQNASLTLLKFCVRLVTLDNTIKSGPKTFFTGMITMF